MIDGKNLTCEVTSPDGIASKLSLTVDGDHLMGDIIVSIPNGENMKGKMDLNRVK